MEYNIAFEERSGASIESSSLSELASRKRLRIAVLGYIVRGGFGGLAWHHLQYVVGLLRLGHDVLFLEDSDDFPSCVHLDKELDADPTEGLAFADRAFRRLGIAGRYAYHDAFTDRWLGPAAQYAEDFCRDADIVLNVSAVNPCRKWWIEVPLRVLIDTDPVFVQVRHLRNELDRRSAETHNAFFTFAENYGKPDCLVPDDGLPWLPTRQPIVLDQWPVVPMPDDGCFSTVLQWDSYPAVRHEGREFGMKSASFGPYLDLPQRCRVPLVLGIGGASRPPRQELLRHGWKLQEALEFARDPWGYQQFVQRSWGEFSVAKHGYVLARTGWFSERSANYLASGRPVVLQDTGFSSVLPTGEGLLAFRSPEEAVQALDEVSRDLSRHAKAARMIAEQHFDSNKVLNELLVKAMEVAQL